MRWYLVAANNTEAYEMEREINNLRTVISNTKRELKNVLELCDSEEDFVILTEVLKELENV